MDRLTKGNKAICEPSLTCPHDEAHRPVNYKEIDIETKDLTSDFLAKTVSSPF